MQILLTEEEHKALLKRARHGDVYQVADNLPVRKVYGKEGLHPWGCIHSMSRERAMR